MRLQLHQTKAVPCCEAGLKDERFCWLQMHTLVIMLLDPASSCMAQRQQRHTSFAVVECPLPEVRSFVTIHHSTE